MLKDLIKPILHWKKLKFQVKHDIHHATRLWDANPDRLCWTLNHITSSVSSALKRRALSFYSGYESLPKEGEGLGRMGDGRQRKWESLSQAATAPTYPLLYLLCPEAKPNTSTDL